MTKYRMDKSIIELYLFFLCFHTTTRIAKTFCLSTNLAGYRGYIQFFNNIVLFDRGDE